MLPLYSADNSGTAYGSFLKIGASSRLIGRGEAVTALVDDPSALTANVAGLGNIDKMEILFSHYEWITDLDYEHLAIAKPMFKGLYKFQGVMGFGISYIHLPSFPYYNDWAEAAGELNYNALAFAVGYGQKLYSFDIGLSLKMLREEVVDKSYYGFMSDIGLIYTYKIAKLGKSIKGGLTVQNIGGSILEYTAPMALKLGLGSEIINDLEIGFDIEQPFDADFRINLGAEYNIRNYFNIRTGYRFLGYRPDSFTLGVGIRYPFDNKLVKVDVAYAPEGVLKDTEPISFGVKFPGIDMEKEWRIANTLYYKGIYYYTNGKLEKAIELWREALKVKEEYKKGIEK